MSAEQIKELGMIIVPISLALLSIVNIMISRTVHTIVNSAMTQEKTENAVLRSLLTVKQLEVDNAEKARIALASAVSTVSTIASVVPTVVTVPTVAASLEAETTPKIAEPVPVIVTP